MLVPIGHVAESSDRSKTNFVQVKGRAQDIERLYASAGVLLPTSSGLGKLIANAKTLSDRWLCNEMEGITMVHAFYALHLQRVADAVLALVEVPTKERYLNSLTSGDIDFFSRGFSNAKDILWELELWSLLRERSASALLSDPPDIEVHFSDKKIGIACKKIYSENNVEKVLSQAVEQVEDDFDVGVVAINLDELVPGGTVLKVNTEQQMAVRLQQHCADFLGRHERHFRKYLSTGRLVAALVSVHVIADVAEWDVPFNNCRQSTVWTIPSLTAEKEALMRQFQRIVL